MTFDEFVLAYANHYGSKGETWLQQMIVDRLQAGMTTMVSVCGEIHTLTDQMVVAKSEDFAEYGFLWSFRSRLEYMIMDWDRYQATGEKYFKNNLQNG
ncbi:hypothetical protein D3C76_212440 [compost metagenome]